MKYSIRKAQQSDIDVIIQLCVEHAAYEKANYSPENKAIMLSPYLFSEAPRLFCLIAENETSIVGYTTYMLEFSTWNADFYINMDCLYLRPAARGFGIGEALVNEIKQYAMSINCRLIQWQTPTFNERAIKFYHRIGAVSKEKSRMYLSI